MWSQQKSRKVWFSQKQAERNPQSVRMFKTHSGVYGYCTEVSEIRPAFDDVKQLRDAGQCTILEALNDEQIQTLILGD